MLSEIKKEKIEEYVTLLKKWNKAYNLVSPKTIQTLWQDHLEGCFSLCEILEKHIGDKVIYDLGSGSGMPSVIIATVLKNKIHAVETIGKKTDFLKEVKRKIGLENFYVEQKRVEKFTTKDYGITVVSKAFADITKTLSLTKHLWQEKKVEFFLLKGNNLKTELEKAKETFIFKEKIFRCEKTFVVHIKNVTELFR